MSIDRADPLCRRTSRSACVGGSERVEPLSGGEGRSGNGFTDRSVPYLVVLTRADTIELAGSFPL